MVTKRVFCVLLIAALAAAVLLVARVPLVSGQGESGITVNLTPYEGNPILAIGEAGAWDVRGVGMPRVIYNDGKFHMFYSGWTEESGPAVTAIGYATSEDGLNWTRYEGNPVFVLDSTVPTSGVLKELTILDGEMWVMYFTPSTGIYRPSETVLRATAPSPTGPWTVDPEPVLAAGTAQDWDRWTALAVDSVLRTDEGYVLYYTLMAGATGDGPYYTGSGIGRAVSPDGIHWTKYDDPATTEADFAVSDPVFVKNPQAWDSGGVGEPVVRFSEDGWEMFYYGSSGGYWSMGYATSEDGISWTRHGTAPILTGSGLGFDPGSVLVFDDTYYLYYGYYEARTDTAEIWVATGTVTRE
jgi:predicted GH43/DUF377 family glycosyl hydrolase